MKKIEGDRPRLIQGSHAPLFRSTSSNELLRCACGQVLIEGYLRRRVIALDLQCFKCNAITTTAEWPAGEPLPSALVTIGRTGKYLINSSVDLDLGQASLCCDQEIERVRSQTGVGSAKGGSLDLSPNGVSKLEELFCSWWERFPKCLQSTSIAFAKGNMRFLKFPPAWAIEQLKRSIATGTIDVMDADGVAIGIIQVLLDIFNRWNHHPGFEPILKATLFDFKHNVSQMLAASYLSDAGNWIGFGEPKNGGGRSSDMFINLDSVTRHSLEIKAPDEFWWPAVTPNADRMKKILESKFRSARGQIETAGGGVLVIGGCSPSEQFLQLAHQVTEELNKEGRIPSRMAGIAIVGMLPFPQLEMHADQINVSTYAQVTTIVNARYAGPGQLQVARP